MRKINDIVTAPKKPSHKYFYIEIKVNTSWFILSLPSLVWWLCLLSRAAYFCVEKRAFQRGQRLPTIIQKASILDTKKLKMLKNQQTSQLGVSMKRIVVNFREKKNLGILTVLFKNVFHYFNCCIVAMGTI